MIGDDPNFRRKGDDLFTDVTIDLYTAVLGGEVTVNTLDGQVKLKVRPGTQNDAMVRLKGKGFPVYKQEGSFGDLIVTYHITHPHQSDRKAEGTVPPDSTRINRKTNDYAKRFDHHQRILQPLQHRTVVHPDVG